MPMNWKTGLCVAAAGIVVAQAGFAQDSAAGLTFSGYVELEHLSGDISDDTFLLGDVTLSTGRGLFAAAPGLGFDLGMEFVTDGDDGNEAIYAALTYSFGPSKFSIGIPRGAYGSLDNRPALGGSRLFDLELAVLNKNLVDAIYLLSDDDAPYGLRYDGDYGNVAVAASYHRFDDIDADAFGLAASYKVFQPFVLMADYEIVDDGGSDVETMRIGGESDWGRWQGGLFYFHRSGLDADGTDAWFSYLPTEEITVTATALNTNVIDVYGLSLEYEWPIGAYGQIGVLDGRSVGTIYDVSLGWKF